MRPSVFPCKCWPRAYLSKRNTYSHPLIIFLKGRVCLLLLSCGNSPSVLDSSPLVDIYFANIIPDLSSHCFGSVLWCTKAFNSHEASPMSLSPACVVPQDPFGHHDNVVSKPFSPKGSRPVFFVAPALHSLWVTIDKFSVALLCSRRPASLFIPGYPGALQSPGQHRAGLCKWWVN